MSRTWLITGVSSGFGYEMTKQLLEKGDVVIGTVRNTTKVEDLIQKYPVNFDCRILDVTDVAAVQQTVKESFEKHGKIDVVVSKATACLDVQRNCRMMKSITSLQLI
jgi:NADP-dependent 3-hydroxy acid dehydrogenase YdfG